MQTETSGWKSREHGFKIFPGDVPHSLQKEARLALNSAPFKNRYRALCLARIRPSKALPIATKFPGRASQLLSLPEAIGRRMRACHLKQVSRPIHWF